jgi:leucine dehydrogenase
MRPLFEAAHTPLMETTEIQVDGYEKVLRCRDSGSGLHALIAVHDTTLGPALGGMRMLPYSSEDEALFDVLRLAEGMTYKSACAETGLGGGKSVIIGDPKTLKKPDLLKAMGRFVQLLDGRYITAEDMNIGVADLEIVRTETKWVTGLSRETGSSGNPSPYTAHGVLVGLHALAQEVWGSPELRGKHVLIQGVGAVGGRLAQLLKELGARITICDINEGKVEEQKRTLGYESVADARHLDVACDIYAPCARGAGLNEQTIPRLKCKAVGGAANNQLLDWTNREGRTVSAAQALKERGILYAPDFVINAGGIINVAVELFPGGYREAVSLKKIENIAVNLRKVFEIARQDGVTTHDAALRLARQRLDAGKRAQRA